MSINHITSGSFKQNGLCFLVHKLVRYKETLSRISKVTFRQYASHMSSHGDEIKCICQLNINPEQILHIQNSNLVKIYIYGATRPLCVDPALVRVKYYQNHLKRELLPACDKLYDEKYYFMQVEWRPIRRTTRKSTYEWSLVDIIFGRINGRQIRLINPHGLLLLGRTNTQGTREPTYSICKHKRAEKRLKKVWKEEINFVPD